MDRTDSDAEGRPPTLQEVREYFPHQRMSTYILVLPEHGVVHVKNPKAGCSTLLAWLDRIHTGELDREFGNIHREHRVPRITKSNRRRVLAMLGGDAYRFAFVRHPATRLESAYRDKVADNPAWRPHLPARLGLDLAPEEQVTFERFVEAVEHQHPVTGMNPHWRPQHINLMHPIVTYDRIGRIESFDADLRRVVAESGLPDVRWTRRNTATHDRPSVYDGRADLRRRVEELYALDMDLYGY